MQNGVSYAVFCHILVYVKILGVVKLLGVHKMGQMF